MIQTLLAFLILAAFMVTALYVSQIVAAAG
jgi:hypothetical protein